MRITRYAAAGLGILAILLGCAPAHRQLGPLPPPVMNTRPERPPVTATPRPAPRPMETPGRRGFTPIGPVTIVVDAGHGGHDPGARGLSPVPEKTINLRIANQLAEELERRGARVITTRSTDRFLSLDERSAIAARSRADLFVSIHADSSRRSSASGVTIYVSRSASDTSRHAARCIQNAITAADIECRGIQSAGFRVLVDHPRPAVLIECGFLTNRSDVRNLNDPEYQSALPEAIAEGIAMHFQR